MACEIAIEDPRQPELLALLADDDAHYAALYPAESNHLAAADVTFLVARVSHRAPGLARRSGTVSRSARSSGCMSRLRCAAGSWGGCF
jgi:hypothetical protein